MSVIDRDGTVHECENDGLPKALTMTVYPTDSSGVYFRPGYKPNEGPRWNWHDYLVAGPIEMYGKAAAKHFSDAELAAEYWAEMGAEYLADDEHIKTLFRFAIAPSAGVKPEDIP